MADIPSPIYLDLAAWAASQSEFETKNGEPAPLNSAQRKALLDLHKAIKPPPPGSTDWVSLLHRKSPIGVLEISQLTNPKPVDPRNPKTG